MLQSLASAYPQPAEASIRAAVESFRSTRYVRHNMRRLEHLASLGLPLAGRTVLEPGAGLGDHTSFYLDRGCWVTALEPRAENVAVLRQTFAPGAHPAAERLTILEGDHAVLDDLVERYEVVHAYGLLYHLADPAAAIAAMARRCSDLLLLETCVSFGEEEAIHPVKENGASPTQSVEGLGCRPTRAWVLQALRREMPFAYATATQPAHEEFPTDWRRPTGQRLSRAVFVASRSALESPALLAELPMTQARHLA